MQRGGKNWKTRERPALPAGPPSDLGPGLAERRSSSSLKRNDPSAYATLVGERDEFHSIPEIGQALDEAVFLPFLGAGIEVVGAEVLIHRSVLEHMVDGAEHRGSNGDDRLIGG